MWNIKPFHRCFKVNHQGLHELGKDIGERKVKARKFQQMIMGLGHDPGRIASRGKQISSVYAGYAIKDPGCGDVIGAAEKSPTILINGTASLRDSTYKLQRVTTCPVRTLSSAASTMRSELIASSTWPLMSRSWRIASRNSSCSRLHSS